MKDEYKTWGNNKFHNPNICKDCEMDTCMVCSNGPRLEEYRRAEAESRLRDLNLQSINEW